VQRLALFAVGNLAFCLENRRILVTSESLRELLLRLTVASEAQVSKAAARALAILGWFLYVSYGSAIPGLLNTYSILLQGRMRFCGEL